MGLKDDVSAKVKDYLSGDYKTEDTKSIPSVEDLPFGKIAKKVKLCVLAIDLRHSSELLIVHQKQTAGKIHKAFLHTAASTVLHFDGYIRGFKGDSLLALWPSNYKSEITKCVRTAMTIKYLLAVHLSSEFAQYSDLDFGIGVDWGEVLVARAGIPRDTNNNDLVFLGRCINLAVAISEQARGPDHVEISKSTYDNLEEDAIDGMQKDYYGNSEKVDMWRTGTVTWNGEPHATKVTNWYWEAY